MGRTSSIPQLEAKVGMRIDEFMRKGIKEGKQPNEIASEIGISNSQIYAFINEFGLKPFLKETRQQKLYSRQGSELKTLIDDFIDAKTAGNRSPNTIKKYKDTMHLYLWWLEDMKQPSVLGMFNSQAISKFLAYMKNTRTRFGGVNPNCQREVKSSTIHTYRKTLNAFGAWLQRQGKVEENPVSKTETIIVSKRLPEDIPDEVLIKVLNSFDNSFEGVRNKTIILMFLDTGMRLEEVSTLKATQFDLATGWTKIIGKGDKQRLIKLTHGTLAQLNQYATLREPLAHTEFLWVYENGKYFGRESVRKMVYELQRFDKGIHPHVFRHIWAKTLAKAKINVLHIATMGGWSSLALVQHYAAAYTGDEAWADYDKAAPVSRLLGGIHDNKDSQETAKATEAQS